MAPDFRPLLVILLGLSCCRCTQPSPPPPAEAPLPRTTVTIGGAEGSWTIEAEVVASPERRQQGLMFRKSLGAGEGMLFVFSEESEHSFWMKNTLIPLDMIFIDSQLRIVGIVHEARPGDEGSLTVGLPSRYVLEVAGGSCRRHRIARGQSVSFRL